MGRQGGGQFQRAAFRMGQAQRAGMQMQRAAKAFQMRGLTAILTIAHDRAAQSFRAMHAQLMGAAGQGLQFQHRCLPLC